MYGQEDLGVRLEFFKKHLNLILMVVVVLMGIEILYLVRQNNRLAAVVRDPKQVFKTLESGDTVPVIRTFDLEGNNLNLQYGAEEPHTFLFWFAPGCYSCDENLEFWNSLYLEYASDGARFVGMCACEPDDAREVVVKHGLEFAVTCATDPFIVEMYKGNALPQTVHIAPEGTISKVWTGPLVEGQKEEILSVLESLK